MKAGGLTVSVRITDGRTDACRYSRGTGQVWRLIARYADSHGQLPHSIV